MDTAEQTRPQDKIGNRFIKAGLLTQEQVETIVNRQNEYNIRFGEAAIQLGLLTQQQVQAVLAQQFNYATALIQTDNLSDKLIVAHDPFGLEAENIRHIRSEISVRLRNQYPIAFVIASAKKGEGKSYLAANLALAFSQMGKRTLLIDGNMRDPSQHKLFSIQNKLGLSTVLSERSSYDVLQQISGFPDLCVLTAGATPPNPLEIMMNGSVKKLIDHYASEFSVFIIDAPAVGQYADTQTLAEQIGMYILVGKKDYTTFEDLRSLQAEMTTSGAQNIGSVYNEFSDENLHSAGYQKRWTRIRQWFQRKK